MGSLEKFSTSIPLFCTMKRRWGQEKSLSITEKFPIPHLENFSRNPAYGKFDNMMLLINRKTIERIYKSEKTCFIFKRERKGGKVLLPFSPLDRKMTQFFSLYLLCPVSTDSMVLSNQFEPFSFLQSNSFHENV